MGKGAAAGSEAAYKALGFEFVQTDLLFDLGGPQAPFVINDAAHLDVITRINRIEYALDRVVHQDSLPHDSERIDALAVDPTLEGVPELDFRSRAGSAVIVDPTFYSHHHPKF
jgi:hypothetical protein